MRIKISNLMSKKDIWSTLIKIKPIDKEAALGSHSEGTSSIKDRRMPYPISQKTMITQLLKEALNVPIEKECIAIRAAQLMKKKSRLTSERKLKSISTRLNQLRCEKNKLQGKLLSRRKNIYNKIVNLLMINRDNSDKLEQLLLVIIANIKTRIGKLPDDFSTFIDRIRELVSQSKMPKAVSFSMKKRLKDLSLELNSLSRLRARKVGSPLRNQAIYSTKRTKEQPKKKNGESKRMAKLKEKIIFKHNGLIKKKDYPRQALSGTPISYKYMLSDEDFPTGYIGKVIRLPRCVGKLMGIDANDNLKILDISSKKERKYSISHLLRLEKEDGVEPKERVSRRKRKA